MSRRREHGHRWHIPRFFFHISDGRRLWPDDTGTEFIDLEGAYLDAFRAAGEIAREMAGQGHDASTHCFEIRDDVGHLLMDLPFSEAMGTSRSFARGRPKLAVAPKATIAVKESRALAVAIAREIEIVRRTIEQTNGLLRRSRATASRAGYGFGSGSTSS